MFGAENITEKPVACDFNDVAGDDWYYASVHLACENGVTKGKKYQEFKPNDKLTRAEAAVMIKRALDVDFDNFAEQKTESGQLLQPILAPLSGFGI